MFGKSVLIVFQHKYSESPVYTNIYSVYLHAAFSSKLGYEEHIPGQTRDWNEELQTTRELPRKNLPERLLRERAIFKVRIQIDMLINKIVVENITVLTCPCFMYELFRFTAILWQLQHEEQ